MRKFSRYFLQGLVYLAPIGVTGYILYLIYRLIDRLLKAYIDPLLPVDIPGINLLLVIVSVTLLGFLGQSIIFRPLRNLANKMLDRTPVLKTIYTAVNDFLKAVVGKEKKFREPVLVRVNTISNLEKLGFLTNRELGRLGIRGEKVAVYFPHSYNFSGELFIVPVENITPIALDTGDTMKFIVSGGVSGFSAEPQNVS